MTSNSINIHTYAYGAAMANVKNYSYEQSTAANHKHQGNQLIELLVGTNIISQLPRVLAN